MFLRSHNFKNYCKTYSKKKQITQNKWSEKSPSEPFVARQKTLLLCLLQIDTRNYYATRVIRNFLLLHTSKVFPGLNTYNRNLTFLKARENNCKLNSLLTSSYKCEDSSVWFLRLSAVWTHYEEKNSPSSRHCQTTWELWEHMAVANQRVLVWSHANSE